MSKMLEGVFLLVVIVGLFDRANLFSTPTVLSGLIHFLSPSPYGGRAALLAWHNDISKWFHGLNIVAHICANLAGNLPRPIPIQPNSQTADYQGSDQKLPFRMNEARTE